MNHHYRKIADAINYLTNNSQKQPSLEDVAAHVHLSPFHFQRLFTEWAGVSPKKFLQFLTVSYAKQILSARKDITLFDAADEAGLSGTGRLHDLFVNIEGMTPAEFRDSGKDLVIQYSFNECRFGEYLVASTSKGICNLYFIGDDREEARNQLYSCWQNATIEATESQMHQEVHNFFTAQTDAVAPVRLHLKGTAFQLKVWEALLKIPQGRLSTYGNIAAQIGQPSASRAVGSAIGCNEVAFLIPCHRVIRNSCIIGDFRWGTDRKKAIIGWEAAQNVSRTPNVQLSNTIDT